MSLHRNAKLGLAGRYAPVCAIAGGVSLKAAAVAFDVSSATAHRWWHRWLEAAEEERRTLSCLFDRSSRPHCSPRQLAPELAEAICECRRRTGWGPRLVAGATGFAHSTVWKVLRRAGLSRRSKPAKEPANSYEWPCPGDLLHMDVSRYARFLRPGHRVTGDRSHRQGGWMRPATRVGYDYAHAIVDDHSRLAFVELHDDDKAATVTGFAHSTVWKVLRRAGISRPPSARREPANRYEWPCPGDLLHMDVCRYARFLRPGHRVTGDRSQSLRGRSVETRVGYDYAHAIVDDHSRLAFVELHDDEKGVTVTGFVERALAFFAEHGIVAKRLMSDNAFTYVYNRSLRELLTRHRIRHLTTEPYRPRTNGKVERFHQTMAREWAYGLSYHSHRQRNRALPHWLDHYNSRRPHSSLGDRPPISRVHNVRG